jgi:hypothetical protein
MLLDDLAAAAKLDGLLREAEAEGEFFKYNDAWHAWAVAGPRNAGGGG